ncbi:MAG: hypothetical protein M3N12_07585 [Verrucomicrobiota bacterium]|nr:hypothetical protein [Verrucomicrobiota bacterium]
MNSWIEGIKVATADADSDIRAAVERFEAESVEADKEAASRASDIRAAATRMEPSCSVDLKTGRVTFISFDPAADAAATIALVEKAKAKVEREPGSKKRTKIIRILESLIAQFSASIVGRVAAFSFPF